MQFVVLLLYDVPKITDVMFEKEIQIMYLLLFYL